MKICSNCKKKISNKSSTCDNCGKALKVKKKVIKKNNFDSTQDVEKSFDILIKFIKFMIGAPIVFIGFLIVLESINYFLITEDYSEKVIAEYKESINCTSSYNEEYCDIVYVYKVGVREYTFTDVFVSANDYEKSKVIFYDIDYPKNSISIDEKSSNKMELFMGILVMFVGVDCILRKGAIKVKFK